MKQKRILIIINLIFGSLVLLSYFNGLSKFPDLSSKLWGGVPLKLQPIIICSMFTSALGYLLFTYNFLVNIDANKVFFNYFNYSHLNIIYLLLLIPSMLWINLTFKYMNSGSIIDWVIVILMLFSVAISSILLLLFTINAKKQNSFLYVLGATFFTFHTVFFDAILWTIFFNKSI